MAPPQRFRVLPCSPASVSQAPRRRAEARVDTTPSPFRAAGQSRILLAPTHAVTMAAIRRPPLHATNSRATWQPRNLVSPAGCSAVVRQVPYPDTAVDGHMLSPQLGAGALNLLGQSTS